jgi:FlaG/FlaF family flagellin (archaellin)
MYLRTLLTLAATVAVAALGTASTASAEEAPPAAGSTQVCVGVSGGFLLQINGFGSRFPANETGTTTFTFADGRVVSLSATTNDEGIFHTATFTLDLRDPEVAALVGTTVRQVSTWPGAESTLTFRLVGCPVAPDGRVACLDGGFESYPALGFLNQGDCVSWIATQGRNEPGQNVPG